jgi:hypothetical protein
MATTTAEQFDLISDDPRRESGIFDELLDFVRASKEHRGLITMTQAARLLGVTAGQVSVWVSRGRLSIVTMMGVKMVSAGETLALMNERRAGEVRKGGRGNKAPDLADFASAAWDDLELSL